MKTLYVMVLMMLSVAEIVFTALYVYLTQRIDEIPLIGGIAYLATVYCVHHVYKKEDYQDQKRQMIRDLIIN